MHGGQTRDPFDATSCAGSVLAVNEPHRSDPEREFAARRCIVVTGAAGFVGSAVMQRLLAEVSPSEVWALVHSAAPSVRNDDPLRVSSLVKGWQDRRVHVVSGDVVTGEGLRDLPRSPTAVIHLATCADTAAADHRVNDVGTQNLLDCLAPLGADTRFIFTSTVAVSENREGDRSPAHPACRFARPRSEYGRRKFTAEQLLSARSRSDGFSLMIARLPVVFGDGSRRGGFVDLLRHGGGLTAMMARLRLPGRVSFVHVEAVAEVLVNAALTPNPQPTNDCNCRYLSSESHAIGDLLNQREMPLTDEILHGAKPAGTGLGWTLVERISRSMGFAERFLPRRIYNRWWQVHMMICNGFETVVDDETAAIALDRNLSLHAWLHRPSS